jgi:hypothetical protein
MHMYTYMDTWIHTMHAYIHIWTHTHTGICILQIGDSASKLHTYIYACMYAYIYAYMYTYIYRYRSDGTTLAMLAS